MYEQQIISYILTNKDIKLMKRYGLTSAHFLSHQNVILFIEKYHLKYKAVPSKDIILKEFPNFQYTQPEDSVDYLANQLRETFVYTQLAPILKESAEKTRENSIEAIQFLKENIDTLVRESNTKIGIGNDIVSNASERLEEYKQRQEQGGLLGISSGIKQLDEILYGWTEEDLVTLVARSGEGKSWILLYFSVYAWKQGKKVLFYSGEMSANIVGFRFDTLLNHFSNKDLMAGKEQNEEKYKKHISELENKSGFIVITPEELGGKRPTTLDIFELADYHKPDIIVLDYLALIDDWKKAKEKRDRLGNISSELQHFSASQAIPILTASQANREASKKNQDKENPEAPSAHEISDSDQILQNSTRVIGLARVDNILKLAIRKNRYGISEGEVLMHWDIDKGILTPLIEDEKIIQNDYGF